MIDTTLKLVFSNDKGGCTKTTTCVTVGAGLGKRGKKVLIIDQCPQGNATKILLPEGVEIGHTTSSLYTGTPLSMAIYHTTAEGVDIVPATKQLNDTAEEIVTDKDKNLKLLKALSKSAIKDYDYVLIDSPPLYGPLVMNSLYAADRVITPVSNLTAFDQLAEHCGVIEDIAAVKPGYCIDSVILTMVEWNNVYFKEMRKALEGAFNENQICKSSIPKSVLMWKAYHAKKSIFDFAPKRSKIVIECNSLIDELLIKWEGVK